MTTPYTSSAAAKSITPPKKAPMQPSATTILLLFLSFSLGVEAQKWEDSRKSAPPAVISLTDQQLDRAYESGFHDAQTAKPDGPMRMAMNSTSYWLHYSDFWGDFDRRRDWCVLLSDYEKEHGPPTAAAAGGTGLIVRGSGSGSGPRVESVVLEPLPVNVSRHGHHASITVTTGSVTVTNSVTASLIDGGQP